MTAKTKAACRCFLLALLFACSLSVRAQLVEIYGTVAIPHVSHVATGSPSGSNYYTSFTRTTFGGGLTYNFLPLHYVSLGADLRGSKASGTPGTDDVLFGLKLGVRPPVIHLKPYVQASIGYGVTRVVSQASGASANTTLSNSNAIYQVFGGVDYPLMKFVDWRAAEIGVGHTLTNAGSNPTFVTFNTGIVVHF